MSDICDFGRILNKECNLTRFNTFFNNKTGLNQLTELQASNIIWKAGPNINTSLNGHLGKANVCQACLKKPIP